MTARILIECDAVKRCKEAGETWQRNGHTLHVGQFQIDRIEANGDFTAGCHYIKWPEIERVVRLAGVLVDGDTSALVGEG